MTASGLAPLLGTLLDRGHAVSFTFAPSDGVVATIDVLGDDDVTETHDGIGDTLLAALEAAAFGLTLSGEDYD